MAQGSAPSLQADRHIIASELNSPTQQVQLAPVQRGSHQLLNSTAGSLGAPHNNACWWRLQLSHGNRNSAPHTMLGEPSTGVTHAHGTISSHLAAPTYGASPHGPVSHYLSFTASCIRDPGGNVQCHPSLTSPLTANTQYQWNQTHPAPTPNSPLMYGVIRLPAGEPPAATLPVLTKLDPIMRSGTTHAMEPLALTACGLTWCWPQTLGPATMAPYPLNPTQYNPQLLTANGTTRPTTCETINPLPVKLVINPHPTRELTLSGEPSTTTGSGATSPHWTNGNTMHH